MSKTAKAPGKKQGKDYLRTVPGINVPVMTPAVLTESFEEMEAAVEAMKRPDRPGAEAGNRQSDKQDRSAWRRRAS